MIKEVRCIVLDRDDVRRAIGESAEMRQARRDTSEIARVELVVGAAGTYGTIHFHPSARTSTTTTIDAPELLEAVLLHCSRSRIPIPMRASKSLDVLGDSLVLNVKKQ